MTTAEMVTAVRDHFGEDSTTATQVSDAQILRFLNQKQKELCADTDVLVTTFTTSTVASQQLYNVPPEYTSIRAIQIYRTTGDKQQQWLARVEIGDLDASFSEGMPDSWANWGANLSGDNSPVFCLDPIPSASGTSDLIVHCRQLPKTMVSGGQAPEVRERGQIACVHGTLAAIYLRLSAGDRALIPLADRYEAKWERDKKLIEEEANYEAASPRPSRDTMGYAGLRRY